MRSGVLIVITLSLAALSAEASMGQQPLTIKLTDENGTSPGPCFVQVGMTAGIPFETNTGYTDDDGLIAFDSNNDLQNEAITAVCPTRPRVTYFKQSGRVFSLQVPASILPQISNVNGLFSNWVNPGQGNNADFGIFVPSFSPRKLLRLQMDDLISRQRDTLTVFGKKINVPTNVSIPKQSLHYTFLTANLEKPRYALDIETPAVQSFMGLAGNFPFEKVVNQAISASGDLFDYLNDMTFYSLTQGKQLPINQSMAYPDLAISKTSLKNCFSLTAVNPPDQLKVVGLSMVQNVSQMGTPYLVSDLKVLNGVPRQMKCSVQPYPLSAAALSVDKESLGISVIVARDIAANQSSVNFDSFYALPKLSVTNSGTTLTFTRSERLAGQAALGFYAVLSNLTDTRIIPTWVVFSPHPPDGNGSAQFQLPVLPKTFFSMAGTQQRWELTWLGQDPKLSSHLQSDPQMDFSFLESATHAARASLDF